MTSKSDNGLLYTLRQCDTGKEPRAAVHANRLKLFHDDRDEFYLKHNITPTDILQPILADTTQSNDSQADDTWYASDCLLNDKMIGKRRFYLVKWQYSISPPSWEPQDNVSQFAIDQYFIRKRAKQRQRRK